MNITTEVHKRHTDAISSQKYGINEETEFLSVEPEPLPFADASFDVVTSKDSIIRIADKHTLAADSKSCSDHALTN